MHPLATPMNVTFVFFLVVTGAIIGGDDTVPVYAAFRHEVDRYNSNVSTTMRLDKVTHFVDVNNNVIVTRERKRFVEIAYECIQRLAA